MAAPSPTPGADVGDELAGTDAQHRHLPYQALRRPRVRQISASGLQTFEGADHPVTEQLGSEGKSFPCGHPSILALTAVGLAAFQRRRHQ